MGTQLTMGSVLLTEELGTIQPLVDREIVVGRWFHIESYLHATDGDDGEFDAWQDGELTFHATGKMMETSWAEWMTGGIADGLETSRLPSTSASIRSITRRSTASSVPLSGSTPLASRSSTMCSSRTSLPCRDSNRSGRVDPPLCQCAPRLWSRAPESDDERAPPCGMRLAQCRPC